MSLKTCVRIFPSILKHANCKQTVLLQNYCISAKHNSFQVPSYLRNVLNNNARLLSTKANKSTGETESQQVYYGILTPQIRAVKIFSLMTSFAGIASQPLIYTQLAASDSVPLIVAVCSFVGFFTLVTPVLLHLIAKKYVTTLMYTPKTGSYTATTLNILNIPKELEFTPDDVMVPDVPGMFTTFTVKGTSLFVDPRLFKDPAHYGKLMGYDKPLDLKLFQTSLNEAKKK